MKQRQPFGESTFRRLVGKLTAEQIRGFPPELVPESIPMEILDTVEDPARRAALEELMWLRSAESVQRSTSARAELDSAVCNALERAEAARDPGTAELDRITRTLMGNWRAQAAENDWLDDRTQQLEQGRTLAAELVQEAAALAQAVDVLDRPFVGRERFAERVSNARLTAKQVLSRMQASLGRFQLLEMDIAHGDMKFRHWQCETNLARLRELDEQIRLVRDKLDRQNRLSARLLRPRVARRQREILAERLQTLTRQRDELEFPISENELLHWLDVLTDASLLVSEEQWQSKAHRTRLLLYRLLNVYCLQQETAAHGLARNPYSGINAREAIEYYLGSEQFMLRYFSRKRQDVTLWLAGAAEDKLAALERVRDAIMSDYRRTARACSASEPGASAALEQHRQQTA